MKTTNELVIAYAKNRTELRKTQSEITGFGFCLKTQNWDHSASKVLELAREEYYQTPDDEPPYYEEGVWAGWVNILLATTPSTCEHFLAAYNLAELRDRRREINRKAGNIKRAIAARGRKLMREQDNENT